MILNRSLYGSGNVLFLIFTKPSIFFLFSHVFLCFFLFLEEIDIKENKNTYLVQFLTEVGYGSLIELTSIE